MAKSKYLTSNGLSHLIAKLKLLLNNKVDVVNGKGLSTNDYTTAEKDKLSSIDYATDSEIQSIWSTGGEINE